MYRLAKYFNYQVCKLALKASDILSCGQYQRYSHPPDPIDALRQPWYFRKAPYMAIKLYMDMCPCLGVQVYRKNVLVRNISCFLLLQACLWWVIDRCEKQHLELSYSLITVIFGTTLVRIYSKPVMNTLFVFTAHRQHPCIVVQYGAYECWPHFSFSHAYCKGSIPPR